MATLTIDKMLIHRSGDESLIEDAQKATLASRGDSWVLELVAPKSSFSRMLDDGHLVRLQWEIDRRAWEACARVRVMGDRDGDAQGNLHYCFEGAEPARSSAYPVAPRQNGPAPARPHMRRSVIRAT